MALANLPVTCSCDKAGVPAGSPLSHRLDGLLESVKTLFMEEYVLSGSKLQAQHKEAMDAIQVAHAAALTAKQVHANHRLSVKHHVNI